LLLKTASVAGGRMLLQVYLSGAKVGVGVGFGVDVVGVFVTIGESVGWAGGVAEQPARVAPVARAMAAAAKRRAIEGRAMLTRIGQ
jgi:hypothetical protein